ncbi:MAG: hypothetical protein K6G68_11745 [Oscillospiraceae bacterium]|nr:hypothetical protein [Ruminococcus sp.]MCR5807687.1 hypothetical protein [Oscillospiraceae bacterium]
MLKVIGAVMDGLAILIVSMRLVSGIANNTGDVGDHVMLLCLIGMLAAGLACIIKRIRNKT